MSDWNSIDFYKLSLPKKDWLGSSVALLYATLFNVTASMIRTSADFAVFPRAVRARTVSRFCCSSSLFVGFVCVCVLIRQEINGRF